jgi:hypothetical protein
MTVNEPEFRGRLLKFPFSWSLGHSQEKGDDCVVVRRQLPLYSRFHNSWHFVNFCPKAEATKRDKIPGLLLHLDQIVLIDVLV